MLEEYKDVLTVEDLCKILRIGKNSAYKLLKNGLISNIKIKRKYIIPKTAVISYLNGCFCENFKVEKDDRK